MKLHAISILSFLVFLIPHTAIGNLVVNTEDYPTGTISMTEMIPDHAPTKKEISSLQKEEKILLRSERQLGKLQKFLQSKSGQKRLGGISDPVDKWFWFWVMGWGLGILISVLAGGALASGGIGIVWFVAFVLGSISLVIWVLKKFR